MQYQTSYRTTQHLESRNHQSSDWQTNRLIPRTGHNLLVFSVVENPDCGWAPSSAFPFFLLSSAFVLVKVLACTFVWLVRAKTPLMEAIIAF